MSPRRVAFPNHMKLGSTFKLEGSWSYLDGNNTHPFGVIFVNFIPEEITNSAAGHTPPMLLNNNLPKL